VKLINIKIERFYAENVDGVYPKIYEILTVPNKIIISPQERKR
jgi:hypothetical protein